MFVPRSVQASLRATARWHDLQEAKHYKQLVADLEVKLDGQVDIAYLSVCLTSDCLFFAPQEAANYKQLVADLEAELARVKRDASEHATQLAQDARAAADAASAARGESARSRVGAHLDAG